MKKGISVFLIICLLMLLANGCTKNTEKVEPTAESEPEIGGKNYINRSAEVSFDGLQYTKCSFTESIDIEPQEQKPYTIMVYLNGTDLESEGGCASGDIEEMIGSGFSDDEVNVILFTGGTSQWQNESIPSDTCMIYKVSDSGMEPLADTGLHNMGDAGTLAAFIDAGMEFFPAQNYGLILWNHGGGSIAGYGVDDNFDYDALKLLELNYALETSKAAETKFEFIGFDACLMSCLESAVVLQKYADYMYASEELEPGNGWDYNFLKDLSDNPSMNGAELGEIIVNGFVSYYNGTGEDATLAVTDLSRIDSIVSSLDTLMTACNENQSESNFNEMSKLRDKTKTFGGGSPRENSVDMVDIYNLAEKLNTLYPDEAAAVMQAVEDAIVYHKNTDGVTDSNGLTIYYTYGGADTAQDSVVTMKSLEVSDGFADYLEYFAGQLNGESSVDYNLDDVAPTGEGDDYSITLTEEELDNMVSISFTLWQPVEGTEDSYYMLGQSSNVEIGEDGTVLTTFDGTWWGINDEFVCMYDIGDNTYAIPAILNGEDVDLIATVNEETGEGKILGARPYTDNSDMASKIMLPIKDGDVLQYCYYSESFSNGEETEWYAGEEFTVNGGLVLEKISVNAGEVYVYGFEYVDVWQDTYYTDFVEVEFVE